MTTDFLSRNAEFIRSGGLHQVGPQAPMASTVVIGCSCPGLTGVLGPALGLSPGEACMIRVAGAWGGEKAVEILRSVALGLHIAECEHIIVVGHRGCRCCPPEHGFEHDHPSTKNRSQVTLHSGPSSPEAGVRETVRALRSSNVVPAAVPIQGFLLDLASGVLSLVLSDEPNAGATVSVTKSTHKPERPSQPPVETDASFTLPDLPLPTLPEITLPTLPPFDLDAATNPPPRPPLKKPITYGAQDPNTGPIPFEKLIMPAPVTGEASRSERQPSADRLRPNTSHINSSLRQRRQKSAEKPPNTFYKPLDESSLSYTIGTPAAQPPRGERVIDFETSEPADSKEDR